MPRLPIQATQFIQSSGYPCLTFSSFPRYAGASKSVYVNNSCRSKRVDIQYVIREQQDSLLENNAGPNSVSRYPGMSFKPRILPKGVNTYRAVKYSDTSGGDWIVLPTHMASSFGYPNEPHI
ncbi:hypothetical protein C8R44DRAFT_737183 [Mycena epipterygia]|nr:hypothetical protein C8R44DRAFT_737183 [Mycena epipterygia]